MEENQHQDEEKAGTLNEPIFGPLPTEGAVQRSLEFDDISFIGGDLEKQQGSSTDSEKSSKATFSTTETATTNQSSLQGSNNKYTRLPLIWERKGTLIEETLRLSDSLVRQMDSIDRAYPGSTNSLNEFPQPPKRKYSALKKLQQRMSIRCTAFYTMILLFLLLFSCLIASGIIVATSNSSESDENVEQMWTSPPNSSSFPGEEARPVH
ncbi:Oidioi.mRNA.OKI2018_I69.PAR.g9520.t1.cds [Oikopleura dioica]|uniref:Oidioi.mRNA.OKI2018_I69.PAR.g9520.t1.cds n=1 Tax=Oikopleura dioica TaxID=34765 RepID=A0ABN7RPK5_OIKDI|nr:Oidioi.mRNA.OKI2018_I69.PAR.g9520.t1.cds [Oikopleura dioica]